MATRRGSLDRRSAVGDAMNSNAYKAGGPSPSGSSNNSAASLPPLTRGPTGAIPGSSNSSSSNNNGPGSAPPSSSSKMQMLQGVFGNNSNSVNSSSPSSSNTAGGSNDHHLPIGGDADMVTALRSKMEKQRVELDLRTDNVNAIQRNFQRLSEMYAADRQRLQEMEQRAKLMAGELESLRAEQKLFRALQAEYAGLKKQSSDAEAEHARSVRTLQTEITNLQAQVEERMERERELKEQLRRQQQSAERDGSLKEKMGMAVLCCESALAETMAMVVDADKKLKTEIRSLNVIMPASTVVADSSSSSLQLAEFSDLKLVSIKEPSSSSSDASSSAAFNLPPAAASDIDLDARVKNHGAALKSFGSTLFQKLSLAARHLASGRQQQDAALHEHATKVADLALQLQRLRDELKATEAAASSTRALAGEASRHAAEERRALQAELQRLRREAWEAQSSLLQASEGAQRGALDAEGESSWPMCRGVDWLQQLRALELKELADKFAAEKAELEASWGKDREELRALQRIMQQQMGDAKSKNSMVEGQMQSLKAQVAALAEKLAKTEQALGEAGGGLQTTKRELLCEQERSKRADIIASSSSDALGTFVEFLSLKIHGTALAELRAERDTLAAELTAEKQHHSATKQQLQKADELLTAAKCMGSETESALQRASREKDREIQTLKRELSETKAKLDSASSKAGSLQENVTSLSDQLRLARESESRTRALHAQSVSDADRARQEAAALQAATDELRRQLSETRERLELVGRKAESADSVIAEHKRALERALAAKEKEAAGRVEHEAKIGELRDWAAQLRALHAQSITTVKKILAAEEACESGYSCQSCLELMKDPLVLAPCGHSFCKGCFHSANQSAKAKAKRQSSAAGDTRSFCPECNANSVTCAVPSASLDMLSGKFAFRCKALKELATVLEKSTTFQLE